MESKELMTVSTDWTREQVDLIKSTVAKGATDDELKLFLYIARHSGLDPLSRQIHAVKRWDRESNRDRLTVQTGIDGLRLIADRTGDYIGSEDAVFDNETVDHPNKATVTVTRWRHGQSCAFTASARWDEYCQTKKDGTPTSMWQKMPYLMLGKCAEALALRKAFPATMSGLYTYEEMGQVENQDQAATFSPHSDERSEWKEPPRPFVAKPGDASPVTAYPVKSEQFIFLPDVSYLGEIVELTARQTITNPQTRKTSQKPGVISILTEDGTLSCYFWERPQCLKEVEKWDTLLGLAGTLSFTARPDPTGKVYWYVKDFVVGRAPARDPQDELGDGIDPEEEAPSD